MNRNKVELMGRLTRDPELKYTPKGTAVCECALATNRQWTDGDGQKQEDVTYVEFVMWGKQAENYARYLVKGNLTLLDGRLKLDQWEDRETGKKRSKMTVVVEGFTFLPNKQPGEQVGGSAPQRPAGQGATTYQSRASDTPTHAGSDPYLDDDADDDIPF